MAPQYEFKWYDVGPDNPFGLRVLDCRPLSWAMVAVSKDPSVAESFARLRSSDGRDLIERAIHNPVRVQTSLRFPHNGEPLNGIAFKAPQMEVKWDIYIYDSVFLFARSWTGDLVYRARAAVGSTEIHITEIECTAEQQALAAANVFFLLASHAMGRVLPHRVPCEPTEPPGAIAMLSFSLFGSYGCYAAFDDITQLRLQHPPAAS